MPHSTMHAPVPSIATTAADWTELVRATPVCRPDSPAFVRAAGRARRLLPATVHDALIDLGDDDAEGGIGALRVCNVALGDLPATPAAPGPRRGADHVSEFVLLATARALGQPVGYLPEHGGDLVQNLVPTAASAHHQTSTSSAVELEFHTETAFHPHRPRYLLLLCLRGDPSARTLLCSVTEVLDGLAPRWRDVLRQPRFRTGVDESFTGGRRASLRDPAPILSGDPQRPTLVFDADLMQGVDDEAQDAIDAFRDLTRANRIAIVLEPGDLLVIDNDRCIHGRSAFRARYDGTDRWLQRSFVVGDLGPSSGERTGRVITTSFV